nr:hypothetical protein [Tanacetum cinerariifolium]
MLECLITTCSYPSPAYAEDFRLRTLTVEQPVDNRLTRQRNKAPSHGAPVSFMVHFSTEAGDADGDEIG